MGEEIIQTTDLIKDIKRLHERSNLDFTIPCSICDNAPAEDEGMCGACHETLIGSEIYKREQKVSETDLRLPEEEEEDEIFDFSEEDEEEGEEEDLEEEDEFEDDEDPFADVEEEEEEEDEDEFEDDEDPFVTDDDEE